MFPQKAFINTLFNELLLCMTTIEIQILNYRTL